MNMQQLLERTEESTQDGAGAARGSRIADASSLPEKKGKSAKGKNRQQVHKTIQDESEDEGEQYSGATGTGVGLQAQHTKRRRGQVFCSMCSGPAPFKTSEPGGKLTRSLSRQSYAPPHGP